MPNDYCDITTYAWLDHDSIGILAASHIQSLALFRDNVVRPSLSALDRELEKIRASDDPTSVFLEGDFAELFQKSVEGYLLTTQSMWERGLRKLLTDRDLNLNGGANARALCNAKWSESRTSLQSHFVDFFGVPLKAFDSYADLDLLQALGNAIRHGDGVSAEKVYKICPTLWINWPPPGTLIEAGPSSIRIDPNAHPYPSFDSITLPQALLEQIIQSVAWFWDDIEHMRCNSFRRTHPTVIRKIEQWKTDRQQRVIRQHLPDEEIKITK